MKIVDEVLPLNGKLYDVTFGEGEAEVVIRLKGDPAAVEAAKHAGLGAVRALKEKMRPEPAPCRGCNQ